MPEARWYAVYTRARHEKQVERLLIACTAGTYLPLVARSSRWQDRTRIIEWPLFPGYVFARFARRELGRVLEVPGVASVIHHAGHPAAIRESELENVRRFVDALSRTEVRVRQAALPARGQRVEVLDGPFAGVQGFVLQRASRRRVLVGLPAIGHGFSVNVDTAALRLLPDEAA